MKSKQKYCRKAVRRKLKITTGNVKYVHGYLKNQGNLGNEEELKMTLVSYHIAMAEYLENELGKNHSHKVENTLIDFSEYILQKISEIFFVHWVMAHILG